MNRIEWNEGMSLGVKVLDDDHKRLLAIINKLYHAVDTNETAHVLDEIFTSLEEYVVQHFQREEALMQKCGYEGLQEHIHQHQDFARQVPELKAKLLGAQDYLSAQEVSIYLTDWLINHIIAEDLPLISLFQAHGLTQTKKKKSSWFTRLMGKTANYLGFEKRILFAIFIPLMGIFFLGSILLYEHYTAYNKMKRMLHVSHIVSDVNELLHALQKERSLSSGYLTAKAETYTQSLYEQRMNVDGSIELFLHELQSIHHQQFDLIAKPVANFKQDIKGLNLHRQMINDKKLNEDENMLFYTRIINNILGIASKMAFIEPDKELSLSIASLSAIMNFKESLGLQRAYGTMLIEQKMSKPRDYEQFFQLSGIQKSFLKEFNDIASPDQKKIFKNLIDFKQKDEIDFYLNRLRDYQYEGLEAGIWFELMTRYIDKIKILENQLSHDINVHIQKRIDSSVSGFVLWSIYLSVFFATTLFITYLLKESSRIQIRQLTEAMKKLARGDRTQRLAPLSNKDDIANMIDAYESSRQKLLEGDIFAKLYLNQKEIELEDKKRETIKLEEIAFFDPLTGLLNRRKFEELSGAEFERALRYKHPLSLLMLDLDHFKKVNDNYGHAIGDIVLQHFSHVCKETARSLDILARIGGEEFVILLPETDETSAHSLAERLRRLIAGSAVPTDKGELKYTVSIGISVLNEKEDKAVDNILERADKALYQAKQNGRNRVCLYSREFPQ